MKIDKKDQYINETLRTLNNVPARKHFGKNSAERQHYDELIKKYPPAQAAVFTNLRVHANALLDDDIDQNEINDVLSKCLRECNEFSGIPSEDLAKLIENEKLGFNYTYTSPTQKPKTILPDLNAAHNAVKKLEKQMNKGTSPKSPAPQKIVEKAQTLFPAVTPELVSAHLQLILLKAPSDDAVNNSHKLRNQIQIAQTKQPIDPAIEMKFKLDDSVEAEFENYHQTKELKEKFEENNFELLHDAIHEYITHQPKDADALTWDVNAVNEVVNILISKIPKKSLTYLNATPDNLKKPAEKAAKLAGLDVFGQEAVEKHNLEYQVAQTQKETEQQLDSFIGSQRTRLNKAREEWDEQDAQKRAKDAEFSSKIKANAINAWRKLQNKTEFTSDKQAQLSESFLGGMRAKEVQHHEIEQALDKIGNPYLSALKTQIVDFIINNITNQSESALNTPQEAALTTITRQVNGFIATKLQSASRPVSISSNLTPEEIQNVAMPASPISYLEQAKQQHIAKAQEALVQAFEAATAAQNSSTPVQGVDVNPTNSIDKKENKKHNKPAPPEGLPPATSSEASKPAPLPLVEQPQTPGINIEELAAQLAAQREADKLEKEENDNKRRAEELERINAEAALTQAIPAPSVPLPSAQAPSVPLPSAQAPDQSLEASNLVEPISIETKRPNLEEPKQAFMTKHSGKPASEDDVKQLTYALVTSVKDTDSVELNQESIVVHLKNTIIGKLRDRTKGEQNFLDIEFNDEQCEQAATKALEILWSKANSLSRKFTTSVHNIEKTLDGIKFSQLDRMAILRPKKSVTKVLDILNSLLTDLSNDEKDYTILYDAQIPADRAKIISYLMYKKLGENTVNEIWEKPDPYRKNYSELIKLFKSVPIQSTLQVLPNRFNHLLNNLDLTPELEAPYVLAEIKKSNNPKPSSFKPNQPKAKTVTWSNPISQAIEPSSEELLAMQEALRKEQEEAQLRESSISPSASDSLEHKNKPQVSLQQAPLSEFLFDSEAIYEIFSEKSPMTNFIPVTKFTATEYFKNTSVGADEILKKLETQHTDALRKSGKQIDRTDKSGTSNDRIKSKIQDILNQLNAWNVGLLASDITNLEQAIADGVKTFKQAVNISENMPELEAYVRQSLNFKANSSAEEVELDLSGAQKEPEVELDLSGAQKEPANPLEDNLLSSPRSSINQSLSDRRADPDADLEPTSHGEIPPLDTGILARIDLTPPEQPAIDRITSSLPPLSTGSKLNLTPEQYKAARNQQATTASSASSTTSIASRPISEDQTEAQSTLTNANSSQSRGSKMPTLQMLIDALSQSKALKAQKASQPEVKAAVENLIKIHQDLITEASKLSIAELEKRIAEIEAAGEKYPSDLKTQKGEQLLPLYKQRLASLRHNSQVNITSSTLSVPETKVITPTPSAHKPEIKHAVPDTSLDSNDDTKSNIDPNEPNYRYFSDPVSGLTAFIDTSKFKVTVIDAKKMKELGITPPDKKFKGLFLHLQPTDNSPALFNVLLHNKSGTDKKDQDARDAETKAASRVISGLQKTNHFKDTEIAVVQLDANISSHKPIKTDLKSIENPENFVTDTEVLTNLGTRLTPPEWAITQFAPSSRVGIKQRENNMSSNQQGGSKKWNTADAATKAMTFVLKTKNRLSQEGQPIPSLESIIDSVEPHVQKSNKFGIDLKDSDHNPTEPVTVNNNTFITQPLINVFGKMGFQSEEKLYREVATTPQEKARRKSIKEALTRDFLLILMDELAKKGIASSNQKIAIDSLKNPETLNFAEYAAFIGIHEWQLIQDQDALRRIITRYSKLPSLKECNDLYNKDYQLFASDNVEEEIDQVVQNILNKNYRITVDTSEGNKVKDPEKNEMITIKQIGKNIAYKVRNHEKQIIEGTLDNQTFGKKLSEGEELTIRQAIINQVNSEKARPDQRLPMTVGAQIINNLSDALKQQLNAGFPEDIPEWDPRSEQLASTNRLVFQTGASVIIQTENSSKKHLDPEKSAEREDVAQRDAEEYVKKWQQEMEQTCAQLNSSKKEYSLIQERAGKAKESISKESISKESPEETAALLETFGAFKTEHIILLEIANQRNNRKTPSFLSIVDGIALNPEYKKLSSGLIINYLFGYRDFINSSLNFSTQELSGNLNTTSSIVERLEMRDARKQRWEEAQKSRSTIESQADSSGSETKAPRTETPKTGKTQPIVSSQAQTAQPGTKTAESSTAQNQARNQPEQFQVTSPIIQLPGQPHVETKSAIPSSNSSSSSSPENLKGTVYKNILLMAFDPNDFNRRDGNLLYRNATMAINITLLSEASQTSLKLTANVIAQQISKFDKALGESTLKPLDEYLYPILTALNIPRNTERANLIKDFVKNRLERKRNLQGRTVGQGSEFSATEAPKSLTPPPQQKQPPQPALGTPSHTPVVTSQTPLVDRAIDFNYHIDDAIILICLEQIDTSIEQMYIDVMKKAIENFDPSYDSSHINKNLVKARIKDVSGKLRDLRADVTKNFKENDLQSVDVYVNKVKLALGLMNNSFDAAITTFIKNQITIIIKQAGTIPLDSRAATPIPLNPEDYVQGYLLKSNESYADELDHFNKQGLSSEDLRWREYSGGTFDPKLETKTSPASDHKYSNVASDPTLDPVTSNLIEALQRYGNNLCDPDFAQNLKDDLELILTPDLSEDKEAQIWNAIRSQLSAMPNFLPANRLQKIDFIAEPQAKIVQLKQLAQEIAEISVSPQPGVSIMLTQQEQDKITLYLRENLVWGIIAHQNLREKPRSLWKNSEVDALINKMLPGISLAPGKTEEARTYIRDILLQNKKAYIQNIVKQKSLFDHVSATVPRLVVKELAKHNQISFDPNVNGPIILASLGESLIARGIPEAEARAFLGTYQPMIQDLIMKNVSEQIGATMQHRAAIERATPQSQNPFQRMATGIKGAVDSARVRFGATTPQTAAMQASKPTIENLRADLIRRIRTTYSQELGDTTTINYFKNPQREQEFDLRHLSGDIAVFQKAIRASFPKMSTQEINQFIESSKQEAKRLHDTQAVQLTLKGINPDSPLKAERDRHFIRYVGLIKDKFDSECNTRTVQEYQNTTSQTDVQKWHSDNILPIKNRIIKRMKKLGMDDTSAQQEATRAVREAVQSHDRYVPTLEAQLEADLVETNRDIQDKINNQQTKLASQLHFIERNLNAKFMPGTPTVVARKMDIMEAAAKTMLPLLESYKKNSGITIDRSKVLATLAHSIFKQELSSIKGDTAAVKARFAKIFPNGIPEKPKDQNFAVKKVYTPVAPSAPQAGTPTPPSYKDALGMTTMAMPAPAGTPDNDIVAGPPASEQPVPNAQPLKSTSRWDSVKGKLSEKLGQAGTKVGAAGRTAAAKVGDMRQKATKRVTDSEMYITLSTGLNKKERADLKKDIETCERDVFNILKQGIDSNQDVQVQVNNRMAQFEQNVRIKFSSQSLEDLRKLTSGIKDEADQDARNYINLVDSYTKAVRENDANFIEGVNNSIEGDDRMKVIADAAYAKALSDQGPAAAPKPAASGAKPAVTFSGTKPASGTPALTSAKVAADTVVGQSKDYTETRKMLDEYIKPLLKDPKKPLSKGGYGFSDKQDKLRIAQQAEAILNQVKTEAPTAQRLVLINQLIADNKKATGHPEIPGFGSKLATILEKIEQLVTLSLAKDPMKRLQAYITIAKTVTKVSNDTGLAGIKTNQKAKIENADKILDTLRKDPTNAGAVIEAIKANKKATVTLPFQGDGKLDGILKELLVTAAGTKAIANDMLKKAGLPEIPAASAKSKKK